MTINLDLLSWLRCPVTGQALLVADPTNLARANTLLKAADAKQSTSSEGTLTAALVSADQKTFYPIRNGIPVLLAEAALVI